MSEVAEEYRMTDAERFTFDLYAYVNLAVCRSICGALPDWHTVCM